MSSFFNIKDISILKLAVLSFLLGTPPELFAQYDDKAEIVIHEDSIKRFRFNILPLLFYTPETEVGFGLGGQSTFFTKGSSVYTRPSSAIVTAIYTSRSQVILSFMPEIYFRNEAYFLEGVMQYKIFPNKFWGLGNRTPSSNEEEYNMVTTWIMGKLLKRLPGEVGFGFTIEVQNFVVIEKVEGGLLDSGVEGADDAVSSMFKVNFDVDTRDNTMNPFRGQFISLISGFASKAIWSTNSFNSIELDARKYINMGDNGVLAARFHIVNTNGDPPFQKMSWFGGGDENRGYFKGRYIDFSFWGLQAEWRFPVWRKFSGAAFVATGDVYGPNSNSTWGDLKYSWGGGLRWRVRDGDNTLLRADFGWGIEDNSGFYFGVNQAF